MKKILSFAMVAVLLVAFALTASAFNFNFEIKEGVLSNTGADSTGVYKIVGTVEDNEGDCIIATKVYYTFDNAVIVPVSAKSGSVANISGGTVKTPYVLLEKTYFDEDTEEDITISFGWTPLTPVWKLKDGTKYSAFYEVYDKDVTFKFTEPMNTVVFEMYFKLAEGKTLSDIKEDTFVVDEVQYATKAYNYFYNVPGKETTAGFVINDKTAQSSSAPADVKIPVTAGQKIYLQDGSVVTADTTGDYTASAVDGMIVVNTVVDGVQTAQKVYNVSGGVATEDTTKADGVVATGESSIRSDATASGIRFKTRFLSGIKAQVAEYGYITTVESTNNALPAGYTLDMALVESGKAIKNTAFVKDTQDIFWNVEGDKTVVTAVITGVPDTAEGVSTKIVTRPYYKLESGAVVYGEAMTRTVFEVAKNIKANDAETYAKYQSYVDGIIALVEGTSYDVPVDFGPLFS